MGTVLGDFPNLYNLSLDESTKKVLFYYRKSIKLIEGVDFTDEKLLPYVLAFKSGLYTNYGNALDNCGRKVASIEQYKKALSIDPHFGMAHGNLGKAYQHYGQLEYDTLRRDYFHYFAYHHLQMGVIDCNPNTYETAKKNFELLISKYCDEYIEAVLKPDLQIPKKEYEDSDELYYRIWCLRNGLFLNTLNDLPITAQVLSVCPAAGFGGLTVPHKTETPFHHFRKSVRFKRSQISHIILRIRFISDTVEVKADPLRKVIGVAGFVGPERAGDHNRTVSPCLRVSGFRDQIIKYPEHFHPGRGNTH